ncbi:MAG: hypothetical protein N3H30_01835 [Candidatus Micrarchaeota archaeon]|nr:hypothetical protein [Candidatus Micrarchaeota archaeon]
MMLAAILLVALLMLTCPQQALGLSLLGEYETDMGPLVGVFADDEGIYLAGERENTVARYSIDSEGHFKKNGTFGGGDAEGSMGIPVDFWAAGGYLYVLDDNGYPHIFNTTTRKLVYRATSGSIVPEEGSAIAALGGKILVADRKKGSVVVAGEYEAGKYAVESSISPSFMGPLVPALASTEDIYVHNGTVYIADTGNQRVQVYNSSINYTGFYGGENAPAGYRIGYPYRIAADGRHLYSVPYGGNSIIAVSKSDGKVTAEFGDPAYSFRDIRGICEHKGKLYVALGSAEKLLIFSIRPYENLTYGEAYAAYSAYAASVERYCEVDGLSKDLSLGSHTSCSRWRARLAEAKLLLDGGDYDGAYEEAAGDSESLAGDLSSLELEAREKLASRHTELSLEAASLARAAATAYKRDLDDIASLLARANSSILAGNYTHSNVLLKEAAVRIRSLSRALGESQASDAELLANYSARIDAAAAAHSGMRAFAESCGMHNESSQISGMIADARSAVEAGDVGLARDRVSALEAAMGAFSGNYSERSDAVSSANRTILRAREVIAASRASMQPFIEPNYTEIEWMLGNASSRLCSDPQEAKSVAEEALKQAEAKSRSYEDTMLLFQFIAGALLFIIILIVLLGTGVRNILKILEGMGKGKEKQ